MKLYPPIIEGTIPAFYGDTIKVPFTMNKSVGENEINGFSLKLKTIQSNYAPFEPIIATIENWEKSSNTISFVLPNFTSLNIGQFYKIQIAYINKTNEIGYYSTVGVVKYTSKPDINILSPLNGNAYEGIYSQKSINEEIRDYTEKVYSYQFTLTDMYNNVIETSGEKLHNSSNDIFSYESKDSYTISTELQKNKVYFLTYSVKTINGLEKSERIQCFLNTGSIDSKLNTILDCKLNYEDGYINIDLKKPNDVLIEETAAGSFYLLRASDEDNFSSWKEVFKFVLSGQQPSRHLWKDMSVKQGVTYKYAIQQFNVYGLRSNKIESNTVKVNFEYAFLFDGERQLKIKYNPKVSSFKNTVLESKVDTIGSKHPFIFKNGIVKYKEFPISGLISYLSDENNLFDSLQNVQEKRTMTLDRRYILIDNREAVLNEEIYNIEKNIYFYKEGNTYIPWQQYIKSFVEKYNKENKTELSYDNYEDVYLFLSSAIFNQKIFKKRTPDEFIWSDINYTNLTEDNIQKEREFKLEVLEWLTNGQPKLFRSPVEGNYIVRLMNVSLSPIDTLGRMIHTFNCTAYEVAENTYENLEKYNFLKNNIYIEPALKWMSIDLSSNHIESGKNLLKTPAASIYLEGMLPGEKISLTTIEDSKTISQTIVIGATGKYIIDLNNNVQISELSFVNVKEGSKENPWLHQGMLTYGYYSNEFKDSFDNITMISNKMVPCEQFIGQHENIIEEIENEKETIESIGFVKFSLRNDDICAYQFENKYYSDEKATDPIDLTELIDIYKIVILDSNKNISGSKWFDGYNNCVLDPDDITNTQIIINNSITNSVDIKDTAYYELRDIKNIQSIKTGAAIITEICYIKKVIDYDLEEEDNMPEEIESAKNNYNTQRTQLEELLKQNTSSTKLKECQEQCKIAYKVYCAVLNEAIQQAERR